MFLKVDWNLFEDFFELFFYIYYYLIIKFMIFLLSLYLVNDK